MTFPSPFSEIPSIAVEGTVDELAAEMAEPVKRDDLNLNLRARWKPGVILCGCQRSPGKVEQGA